MRTTWSADNLADRILPLPKTEGVKEAVQRRLLEFIRAEGLTAGDKLPSQASLGAALGVSQAALREAMRSLEALGIIEARVGSGWYVTAFSFDSIATGLRYSLELNRETFLDLIELRAALECGFLAQAMKDMTPDDRAELQQCLEQLEAAARAGQIEEVVKHDRAFHRKLFSKVKNSLFKQLMDIFWSMYPHFRQVRANIYQIAGEDAANHRLFMEAVWAGDLPLARRRLYDHFAVGLQRYRQLVLAECE